MDQFDASVEKIDKLLKTRLDELIVSLIMIGISAAALFYGRIGEETWGLITGAVLAAWTGSQVYRQGQHGKSVRGALSSAASMVASLVPRPSEPETPQSQPPPASGPGG